MASLAAGLYSSQGKHSRLVTVQLSLSLAAPDAPPAIRSSRVIAAMNAIYAHAVSNSGVGNSVVSMSWGELVVPA
jgi:hypothetical protein